MKKLLLFSALIILISPVVINGQSFDWNVRAGINLMKSYTEGKNISVLYHAGGQAGVRISSFGFYGEVTYSLHENQIKEGDPVGYFIPALVVKGFWRRLMFVELGGAFLTQTGDSGDDPYNLNPDNKLVPIAGLGVNFSKVQISMRSVVDMNSSYGVFQLTAAAQF